MADSLPAPPYLEEKQPTVIIASPGYAYDQPDFVAPHNTMYTPVQVITHNSDVANRFDHARMARVNSVKDYLGWSIFALICCCFPFNVVGLIYNTITREAKRYGDADRAEMSSSKAKNWLIASTVTGVVIIIVYCVLQFYVFRCFQGPHGQPGQ